MIPETDKAVQEIFSPEVSGTYELVNHVLTFGQDVRWRRRAARVAATTGGSKWAILGDRWHFVAGRKRGQLFVSAYKRYTRADDERSRF